MREILAAIKDWLLHKFSTHCDECRHNELENAQCSNCEFLKSLLETERFERDKLQEYILNLNKLSSNEAIHEDTLPQPIPPKHVPWNVKRAKLEKQDREKFQDTLREGKQVLESSKSTEQLESELLGEN